MADWVRTEQTIKRIRYELRSPTNGAELHKALHAASQSFLDVNGRAVAFDDDLTVTAEDELIVVSFRVKP